AASRESWGEPRAGIELLEALERRPGNRPAAVGLAFEPCVVKDHMLAVAGPADIDLGPLDEVSSTGLDGETGVLWGEYCHPAMGYCLHGPRRIDGIEKRERLPGARDGRCDGEHPGRRQERTAGDEAHVGILPLSASEGEGGLM